MTAIAASLPAALPPAGPTAAPAPGTVPADGDRFAEALRNAASAPAGATVATSEADPGSSPLPAQGDRGFVPSPPPGLATIAEAPAVPGEGGDASGIASAEVSAEDPGDGAEEDDPQHGSAPVDGSVALAPAATVSATVSDTGAGSPPALAHATAPPEAGATSPSGQPVDDGGRRTSGDAHPTAATTTPAEPSPGGPPDLQPQSAPPAPTGAVAALDAGSGAAPDASGVAAVTAPPGSPEPNPAIGTDPAPEPVQADAGPSAVGAPAGPPITPAVPPASAPTPSPTAPTAAPLDAAASPPTGGPAGSEPWVEVHQALGSLRHLRDGSERIRVRLHPEELGEVLVEVTARHGELRIHLITETAAARVKLDQDLAQLTSRLTEAGLTMAELDVRSRAGQDRPRPGRDRDAVAGRGRSLGFAVEGPAPAPGRAGTRPSGRVDLVL